MPYYEPAVVYGTWPYPAYPPYYFPPAPGYVVGGALASGIAWGAGFAIGNAIWDGFDWGHGNIRRRHRQEREHQQATSTGTDVKSGIGSTTPITATA